MFDKILIANRGAIACRILRTLRRMQIASVAIYSEADANALHVRQADESFCVGPADVALSYLNQQRILDIAEACGAVAIHPGYGFLSENAGFAESCEAAGIAFIGPTPQQMRDFGLKHTARALAQANDLPLLSGSGLLQDIDAALAEAQRIGYPVMLKSTAGGGGIGMQQCHSPAELQRGFESVRRLAANNFRDSGVFLEKYLANARHIEVQIFGDGKGTVIALGERDCSIQRRNQKVIEETPAPGLTATTRDALHTAAIRLGRAVNYRSAGTVEFVFDADTTRFYFLEVNTRLQVEHGVTEEVGGIDLVEWMIRVAAGTPPALGLHRHVPQGHAIQARVYAEDPARGFRPSSGLLTRVQLPADMRVDSWIETGTEVSGYYDPLLAKIIARGASREAAIGNLAQALAATDIHGIETNVPWLRTVLAHPAFLAGRPTTRLLDSHAPVLPGIEVLDPGTMSTIQDWPGRTGLWDVGIPPSGPMDAIALRLANKIVGNAEGMPGIEMTATGATLLFNAPALIALAGAAMDAHLDDAAVEFWRPVHVSAGSTLRIGQISSTGQRSYLAIQGGLGLPDYMGSYSTFTLGRFGGHGGRALRAGDVLRLGSATPDANRCKVLPRAVRPIYTTRWDICVIDGPHGAPDFFTQEDIARFYAADWEVHYNSSRTGVRLIGPRPTWARLDGGEAGLHPSNIHDNAYAIGSIDYTGDMPVILGPDGPSLGGFVCPATVAMADLWKLGQLRPGDKVRFVALTPNDARRRLLQQDHAIAALDSNAAVPVPVNLRMDSPPQASAAIVLEIAAHMRHAAVCIRQAGEDNLLVEFGAAELDLALRFQVQALLDELQRQAIAGFLELTPGIRSLQVHFDARQLTQQQALDRVVTVLHALPDVESMRLHSRIVHLPLSWDDPATQLATQRYMRSVRADAPWCPDNIEFIRRVNGLDTVDEVRDILFSASYLVMGLGDVYLGAPVATPLDPRHRLVTTKYNPARTWTPENAVGIGGAYLCVYGMEGPGGYQFVGRTVQMWNHYRQSADFRGKPWLLRFFDQIRFYRVSADELLRIRAGFVFGEDPLRIEDTSLSLGEYQSFLEKNADSIAAFRATQRGAFAAERERWREQGISDAPVIEQATPAPQCTLPPGCVAIRAPVTGSIWQVNANVGQQVAANEELLVMEAMKMEIGVKALQGGHIEAVYCAAGKPAAAGDLLLALRPARAAAT
jgi:urea carboxylase